MSHQRKRFTASESGGKVTIYDDEFEFDAVLRVDGDFLAGEKLRYAEAICSVLNLSWIPHKREHVQSEISPSNRSTSVPDQAPAQSSRESVSLRKQPGAST